MLSRLVSARPAVHALEVRNLIDPKTGRQDTTGRTSSTRYAASTRSFYRLSASRLTCLRRRWGADGGREVDSTGKVAAAAATKKREANA